MFSNWFGKKQVEAPAEIVAPEVSASENLRNRIQEAQNELTKIDGISTLEQNILKSIQEELLPLELRAAGLREAIKVGTITVEADGPQAEQIRVYLKTARAELVENEKKQASLNAKAEASQSFLDSVNEQRAQLEEIILNRDKRLTTLEMREMSLKISQSVTDVDNNIDDYRRKVFTDEARHELSTGMI